MRIIFAGTPDFSVPVLSALLNSEHEVIAVYTQPDKASGRGKKLQFGPVKQCALDHQIPVMQPLSLKEASEQEIIKNLKPDLIVVVAYGLLLPQAVLDIPLWGCVNVHASLLPRWRGASPIQQAILAGDKETGVSIMRMEAGLDTGPVFAKIACDILPTDTTQTLHDKLAILGADALLKILPQISQQIPEKQLDDKACYAKKIAKQDGLIDWNVSAIDIDRKVRAFNSWPVAYFYVDGEPNHYVRVWGGEVVAEITNKTPGTIISISSEGMDIAAGNQTIYRITQLQLANAKMIPFKDYWNAGHPLFDEGKCLL